MNPLFEFGNALAAETINDQFLAISEGYFRVSCIKLGLRMGWIVQEGAQNQHNPKGGRTPRADYLSWHDGHLHWERGERVVSIAEGSCDMVIVKPFQMMIECKTKPDIGTKSLVQFDSIFEDVRRVAGNRECAFLFVFDEGLYRSFSDEKEDNRGRKPSPAAARWFYNCFPKLGTLMAEGSIAFHALVDDVDIDMQSWFQRHSPHHSRVICAGGRSDASWLQ